jgi:hypothetical protein
MTTVKFSNVLTIIHEVEEASDTSSISEYEIDEASESDSCVFEYEVEKESNVDEDVKDIVERINSNKEITADDVAILYERDPSDFICPQSIHELRVDAVRKAVKLVWLMPRDVKPCEMDIIMFHELIMRGEINMIREILKNTVHVYDLLMGTIYDTWYSTALHIAVRKWNGYEKYYKKRDIGITAKAMVKLFLEYGADPNVRDYYDLNVYEYSKHTGSSFCEPIKGISSVL